MTILFLLLALYATYKLVKAGYIAVKLPASVTTSAAGVAVSTSASLLTRIKAFLSLVF